MEIRTHVDIPPVQLLLLSTLHTCAELEQSQSLNTATCTLGPHVFSLSPSAPCNPYAISGVSQLLIPAKRYLSPNFPRLLSRCFIQTMGRSCVTRLYWSSTHFSSCVWERQLAGSRHSTAHCRKCNSFRLRRTSLGTPLILPV